MTRISVSCREMNRKNPPLMRPVIDNLEQLIDSSEEYRYKDERELQGKIEEVFERGLIQAEATEFYQRPFYRKNLSDY